MDPLLTPSQVAEILGVSRDTVIQFCNQKKLQCVKVTRRHWRFTEEMVNDFIEKQKSQLAPPKRRPTRTPQPKPTEVSTEDIRKELNSWL